MSAARDGSFAPHPYEGTFRPEEHGGTGSAWLQRLDATEEAGWHRISASVVYEVVEGGPLALSVSPDGHRAEAFRLAPGGTRPVDAGAFRALSCLGAYVVLRVTTGPEIGPADRELMPEDWFPVAKGGNR